MRASDPESSRRSGRKTGRDGVHSTKSLLVLRPKQRRTCQRTFVLSLGKATNRFLPASWNPVMTSLERQIGFSPTCFQCSPSGETIVCAP